MTRLLTLGTDSDDRKNIPMHSGCYAYFAAALAGVARHSKMGNDKHNPGQPLHHSRGKSADHADCIARHLMDIADIQAHKVVLSTADTEALLTEANALAWRALALSQELHEKFGGAPLAPGAKPPKDDYDAEWEDADTTTARKPFVPYTAPKKVERFINTQRWTPVQDSNKCALCDMTWGKHAATDNYCQNPHHPDYEG